MKFEPPRKCKREECPNLIESGRSDKDYCCSECQERDQYQKKAEYEKKLNAIKSEIRKQDRILERHYRMSGSEKIPTDRLVKDGFQVSGYHQQVYHKETDKWYRLFINYAYYYSILGDTIQIFTEYELRTS